MCERHRGRGCRLSDASVRAKASASSAPIESEDERGGQGGQMMCPHAEPEGRAGWEVQMPGSRTAACVPTHGRDDLPSCADVAKRTLGRIAFRMGRCDAGHGEGSCDARGALCSWSHGSQAAGTRLGCVAMAHGPAHGRIARQAPQVLALSACGSWRSHVAQGIHEQLHICVGPSPFMQRSLGKHDPHV